MTDILRSCERFIYAEAELLDTAQFDAWLELFADDAVYWLPLDITRSEPSGGLNIVFDDRRRLEDRVSRLRSGFSHTEEPISRTSHLVGALRLLVGAEAASLVSWLELGPDEQVVSGRFVLSRWRPGAPDTFVGRVTYVLRPHGDTFRMRVKRLDLIDADQPQPAMTFLL
ncbi:MAG: Biphenyl dioxygenase subunit beta [Acidimicrobiia bacterium]|nr:Biphenyl dioxygenase subunit beta [Acidimicrobiia bacterium]